MHRYMNFGAFLSFRLQGASYVPQGGYPFNRYQGCISSLFCKALARYFSMQAPEVLRVVRTYAFGVTEARQPHNAIVVTVRAPEHLKVALLPAFVLTRRQATWTTRRGTKRPAPSRS